MQLKTTINENRKIQDRFLQTYIKHLLADLPPLRPFLSSCRQLLAQSPAYSKDISALIDSLFQSSQPLPFQLLQSTMRELMQQHSESHNLGDFELSFDFAYHSGNCGDCFEPGWVVYVATGMCLDNYKLKRFMRESSGQLARSLNEVHIGSQKQLVAGVKRLLAKRRKIHMLLLYFGETLFDFGRTEDFNLQALRIGDCNYELRVSVCYVSRVALVDIFKARNKVACNPLSHYVISMYERRRQEQEQERLRKRTSRLGLKSIVKWMAGVSLAVGVGLLIYKASRLLKAE